MDWLASIGSRQYDPRWRLRTVRLSDDERPSDYVLHNGAPVPRAQCLVAFVCHPGERVTGAEDRDSFDRVDLATLRLAVKSWRPALPDSRPIPRPRSA